mmetsp:Transcript_60998/g.178393  ORF Transcript_60998/g.178393 Transcript_60998/m.178393 type:complete len:309 (+) Transcript_60998:736-1662(+)
MNVQGCARLGVPDLVKERPREVEDHGVVQNAGRVDEGRQVRGALLDELVHRGRVAAVAPALLHLDVQRLGVGLDRLPRGHVPVADLAGPGEELDAQLLAVLPGAVRLLDAREDPEAHDLGERAVAARDRDDALAGELDAREALLVGPREDLPVDVAPVVEDAEGVMAEGLQAEDVGRQPRDALLGQGPLRVDVLNGDVQLQAGHVAHAVQRGVRRETEAGLFVDLRVVREGVARQAREPLAQEGVRGDLLQEVKEQLRYRLLRCKNVLHAVARRRIDSICEDDKVETAPENGLHLLLGYLFRWCGHNL